ncbi:hypothetical protein LEP1GSC173_3530 [Leptospira interrogans str. HAI1594]|uniref:Uncharacterized protein n=4 Tax=Leptospira interrogans TaxID=173 RepID=A0A0E2D8P4_LEPIR|nr:hypothetical protein G436_4222 [Leptospira interrogans serovar Hardjo str. Norma]EJO77177.1 hypothetical protein LEP1GSC045_0890 [Leptospira interrogans serovar Pomona str. Kennewicki LC82-25]EJP02008.1 hypothetical protein LEP1GSC007_3657 [Leptospira interrogans serovar Bulgarica str. Mallika]EJP14337.1 hypothetical protein LEP1GSC080_4471 [Leptospira interrogans str. FPW2026]EKN96613.1 hypothetical protein LEP1GSC014_3663 [Leptospira interrogans serovar Pomona str. Pomona]EKO23151.1 hypot
MSGRNLDNLSKTHLKKLYHYLKTVFNYFRIFGIKSYFQKIKFYNRVTEKIHIYD